MWRCLVVEDDAHNARFIADGLRELGHVVIVCHDGATALARLTGEAWDLVVLDRMLPNGVDGLSLLAALRGLGKKTPVLVLSALSALDERVRGLKAGGDDYLTKPFAFSELAARAEALVRRSRAGPEIRVLELGDLKLNLASRRAERGGRPIALQPREFRLLAFLMAHPGQVVTRAMLLESVWDYHFDPQTNVIDVQVSRLRSKLEAAGGRPLIHTVRGVGYRMSLDAGEGPESRPDGAGP
ncbi:response regulator transcription factor [Ramlibacter sp. AW1]|uniref:Response regulator transcription factor n=1 Tax=Ramlibacter aurantiacus TaxID=2801330 RepID=A0A936ZL90_9BURK|nr:response regulator transcription factor [Ramlibacter aurantiacus]MBL0423369.1 response regulator transcription factor [Ramlibacter aurantiacus]